MLAAGIATCTAGVGLIRRRIWGLWLALAIFSVNAVGDTINIFIGEPLKGLGGLLIAGGFLFYLLRPTFRSHFR